MRKGFSAAILFSALLVAQPLSAPTSLAQTAPADSTIKGVVYDLGRAEQQLPSLTPSRKANIKRLQRSMKLAADRLNSSPNKAHASWVEAKQRLDTINNALAALASGGAAQPAAPAAATAPTTQPPAPAQSAPTTAQPAPAAADPSIARAQREMNLVAGQVRNLRPSDGRGAMRHLKELYRIGGSLSKVQDRAHPSFQEAAQQYGQIKGALVTLIVNVENERLVKIAGQLDRMQLNDYANAKKVEAGRQSLAGILETLATLSAPKAPAVADLSSRVGKVSAIYEDNVAKNNAQQESLGDVPAKLAALQKRFQAIKVPGRIVHPATAETVRQFIAQVAAVEVHLKEDLSYIQSIDGKAALSVGDGNSFRALKGGLQGGKPQELARIVATVNAEMDLGVEHALNTVKFYEDTDPQDVNHRNNRLTGKGKFGEALKKLEGVQQEIELAALYDKESGRANAPDRTPQIQRAAAATEGFKKKFEVALDSTRMPDAKSKDKKLHKVIAEVAARQDSNHKYERAVINSALRHNKNETGSIRGTSSTSATITVYTYEWDQFQATTAEKVGDDYFLFANTYKYYYSGSPQTPVNTWNRTSRLELGQILKKNIGK